MCIQISPVQTCFPLFSSSDSSQLAPQSSPLSHHSCLRTALCWEKWRMHHLLRSGGGLGHLHLWAHVSVPRLRAEAEETDQCMLPHMQEAYQRCHQNLQAVMVDLLKKVLHLHLPGAACVSLRFGWQGAWPQIENSWVPLIIVPVYFLKNIFVGLCCDHANLKTKTAHRTLFILTKSTTLCDLVLYAITLHICHWAEKPALHTFLCWIYVCFSRICPL